MRQMPKPKVARADANSAHRPQAGTVASPHAVGEASGLALLLRIEASARTAKDQIELHQLIVNETRKVNRARQIFIVELPRRAGPKVTAVTGVASPDARGSVTGDIAALVVALGRERGLAATADFTLPAYCAPGGALAATYPFREMLWLPFTDRRDHVFAGMLAARETPWLTDDITVTQRLSGAYAHAWRELATTDRFDPPARFSSWRLAAVGVAAAALMAPVPLTALAPAEIVASDAMIVTAPIDGVIDQIVVDSNSRVDAGDVLIRLVDTTFRNRLEVARREVAVAEARVKQATLMAFGDPRGRHDLGISQSELDLKRADLQLALDQFQRTLIRATRPGVAVFADRRQLVGKPVVTGERIMEIADPSAVEVRIDLAVPDAIALKSQSHVKLFLDVDPLRPMSGQVVRSDYQARPSDSDVLAFRTFAKLAPTDRAPPRIGLRGTAQVWGDHAPLFIVLLRRPISAARQWLGL